MGAGASASPEDIEAKTADLPDKVDLKKFRQLAGASYSQQIFDAFKDGDECITKERVVGMAHLVKKMHGIRELFDKVANSETRSISVDQLKQLMIDMNIKAHENDFDDPEGTRTLLFPEFLTLMMHRVQDSETEKEILEAFKMFDIDGDGFITVEEVPIRSFSLLHNCTSSKRKNKVVITNMCTVRIYRINMVYVCVLMLHVYAQLQKGMEELGETISKEEAEQMIAEADENNDGRIDFMEYAKKMHTSS